MHSFPLEEGLADDVEDAADSDELPYADASTPEKEETLDAEADEIDPEPELVGRARGRGDVDDPDALPRHRDHRLLHPDPPGRLQPPARLRAGKTRRDADAITEQVKVNDEFLHKVSDDPTLAERLAQRQMKIVRQGTRVLDLKSRGDEEAEMSPFHLTTVPPPDPLPPFQSRGGG